MASVIANDGFFSRKKCHGMLPFSFISLTLLQGVISNAEVCGLLLKSLQQLLKKSKPFVHKLKFVIHIVICNITGKLWWFCKSKEGGKRCCQWPSAPLHRYQQVPHNTAELCAQRSWDHLPSCTPRNAGHLPILQTAGQTKGLFGLWPLQVFHAMSKLLILLLLHRNPRFSWAELQRGGQRRTWGRAPNYRTLYCLQLILVHSEHIASIFLIIKC